MFFPERTSQSQLIPIQEIFSLSEVPAINSLEDLILHIKQRQKLFWATAAYACVRDQIEDQDNLILANLVNSATLQQFISGWEKISQTSSGDLQKEHLPPFDIQPDHLFTGSEFCGVLSRALAEGIDSISIANKNIFRVRIAYIATSYLGEEWSEGNIPDAGPLHILVKVTDKRSGQICYFDPTYAQIDHREVGKIKVIQPDQVADCYQYTLTKKGHSKLIKGDVIQVMSPEESILFGAERLVRIISGK